jgi:hypothetical protein
MFSLLVPHPSFKIEETPNSNPDYSIFPHQNRDKYTGYNLYCHAHRLTCARVDLKTRCLRKYFHLSLYFSPITYSLSFYIYQFFFHFFFLKNAKVKYKKKAKVKFNLLHFFLYLPFISVSLNFARFNFLLKRASKIKKDKQTLESRRNK